MSAYIVHKAVELSALSKKTQEAIEERHWIASPKYDGCHVIICYDNGKHVGSYSRTGEIVRSMKHIEDALPLHYDLPTRRVAFCGEAWWPGREFSELSGDFRRHSNSPNLGFVPFDIVPWSRGDTAIEFPVLGESYGVADSTLYITRIMRLVHSWRDIPSRVVKPVFFELDPGNAVSTAKAMGVHYKEQGCYDGVVLADANGKYIVGSGKGGEFIKFKPLLGESLKVVGLEPAKGVKTGKNTLALVVDYKGQQQRVSTGLTQKEVDDFINAPSLILGETIEVEAMGVTSTGLLREPRYKGIRSDA